MKDTTGKGRNRWLMLGLAAVLVLAGVVGWLLAWIDKDGPGGPIIVISPEPAMVGGATSGFTYLTKWSIECNGNDVVRPVAADPNPTIPERFLHPHGVNYIEVEVLDRSTGTSSTLLVTRELVLDIESKDGKHKLIIQHRNPGQVPSWVFDGAGVTRKGSPMIDWPENMLGNITAVKVDDRVINPGQEDVKAIQIHHNKRFSRWQCN